MVSKRCEICHQIKNIDKTSLCCSKCEDKEIDLLLSVYAYIHCHNSDFCPVNEIVHNISENHGIGINILFIKSWIAKNWLEKNEFSSVRVPPPLYDQLTENGFQISEKILRLLIELKRKPPILVDRTDDEVNQPASKRPGMVFMEKRKS